jgi:hypothetical protein
MIRGNKKHLRGQKKNHIGLAYLRDGKQRCGVSLSRVSPVALRGHMQRIYMTRRVVLNYRTTINACDECDINQMLRTENGCPRWDRKLNQYFH